ncbi:hypothetical protein PGB90_009064 [Kerria lacca]
MSPYTIVACFLIVLGAVQSSPVPSGWGKYEHHIIHVPYHVHHVHHVHKYPVYIKSKPIIIKDHSYHSDWAPSSSGWNSGWDWDK